MQGFLKGFVSGIVFMIIIGFIYSLVYEVAECQGYKDKLVIEYDNPWEKCNSGLIFDMLQSSGIQTNFLYEEKKMTKHYIKYRLTNPSK